MVHEALQREAVDRQNLVANFNEPRQLCSTSCCWGTQQIRLTLTYTSLFHFPQISSQLSTDISKLNKNHTQLWEWVTKMWNPECVSDETWRRESSCCCMKLNSISAYKLFYSSFNSSQPTVQRTNESLLNPKHWNGNLHWTTIKCVYRLRT